MTPPSPSANPELVAIRRLAADPALAPLRIAGSPLAESLGTTLLKIGPDGVDVAFTPGPSFTQGGGVVQGGAVGTMLDFAMAYSAMAAVRDGQSVATSTMTVAFLEAVRPGTLRAQGRIERAGRRMIHVRGSLFDASGRCVASGTSSLQVIEDRAAPAA